MRAHLAAIGCNGQEISRAHLATIGCNGLIMKQTFERVISNVRFKWSSPFFGVTLHLKYQDKYCQPLVFGNRS